MEQAGFVKGERVAMKVLVAPSNTELATQTGGRKSGRRHDSRSENFPALALVRERGFVLRSNRANWASAGWDSWGSDGNLMPGQAAVELTTEEVQGMRAPPVQEKGLTRRRDGGDRWIRESSRLWQ